MHLLFVTTAMFCPRRQLPVHLSFNIFKEHPVHSSFSALRDFWIRRNKGKPLGPFLPGTHRQVKIDKHNVLETKPALHSLGPATYTENTDCWVQDSATPKWEKRARLKQHETLLPCLSCLFLIQHSLGCFQPLTIFQSSGNVDTDSFCSFFQHFCGGMGTPRCSLCHFLSWLFLALRNSI